MADGLLVASLASDTRRRTADRVFYGSLAYTSALTLFWLYFVLTQRDAGALFRQYNVDRDSLIRVVVGFLIFSILWGVVWYGVKSLLLRYFVGFTKQETRQSFASRMRGPYALEALLARYSERRIRIADMIGRRGRFITIGAAGFYYLYGRIATEPTPAFLTLALQDNLFDAVVFNWAALALYYSSGFLARMFWGAQSRVMDGGLARANCLLITTLWSLFKFVLVPIGIQLSARFPPSTFAALFALIWGSYMAADTLSEVVGSLIGRQKLRVWGVGDVNRKSVAGTWAAFLGGLGLGVAVVLSHGLPSSWLGLAVVIAVSNTLFELFSPRGTDDFTMATANALICWAFGVLVY
jgi:dolichol kinase